MDINDGALSYTFLFDTSQGEASIEKLIENLKAMGLSAEEAGKVADELASKMTDALKEIAESAEDAEDAVDKIRDKSDEFRDSAEEVADSLEGMKAEFLADSLDAVGDAIEEDTSLFDKLSSSLTDVNGALDVSQIAMKSLVSVTGKGTTAVKALTLAQKALNAVMAKNPIGVIVALAAAAAAGIVALAKKAKKAAEELKEMNEKVAKTAAEPVEQIEKLSDSWVKLGNDLKAKQKFVDDNAEAFKELGVNVSTVEEAENLLIKNKDAFVKAQMEKAKAIAASAMAQEIMAKKLEAELKKEATPEYNTIVSRGDINEMTGEYDASEVTRQKNKAYTKLEDEIKGYDDKLEKLFNISAESEEKAVKTLEDAGIKSWKEYEDGTVGAIQQAISKKKEALKDAKDADEYKAIVSEIEQLEGELSKIVGSTTGKGGKLDPNKVKRDIEQYLAELKEARERAEDLELANLDDTAANKEKKIRTEYGRQIADAEASALSAKTPELAAAYKKQADELKIAMEAAVKDVYENEAKKQKEALDEMLGYYEEYTYSKKQIDDEYQKDLNAATLAYLTASTEEEKKIYAYLIKDIGKSKADNQLKLDMAKIDSTAYSTVEDKMNAINKAYDTYIENLRLAGASEAQINEAKQEQLELSGKVATINEQIKDLEGKKLSAVESGDVKEVERLNEEIRKLEKQLKKLKETSEKNSVGTDIKKWASEIKASDVANYVGQVGDAIAEIGAATKDAGLEEFGKDLNEMGNAAANIAQGAATGGWIGAVVAAALEVGKALIADIAKMQAFKEAMASVKDEAELLNIQLKIAGESGIFGEDVVKQVMNYVDAMDLAREGAKKYIDEIYKPTTETSVYNANKAMLEYYGFSKGERAFKVVDKSWVANSFGWSDTFMSLQEFAEQSGMELYDIYGNLNADLLKLFKDTFEDISGADAEWLDKAIEYSDLYAEAMDGLASYLEGVFGSTIDTIVDQMYDGAVDIKAITSEVGEQMSKDLMKSAIMSTYFGNLKEDMQAILHEEGGLTDKAAAEIFGMYTEAMARFENDLPQWQSIMEQYQDAFGIDTEAASIGVGTALTSASQESIDLMNGQLNAMRAYQGRMEGMVNSVLLQLSGIHNDMNGGFSETNRQLQEINSNTSMSGLGRSLGAYFG